MLKQKWSIAPNLALWLAEEEDSGGRKTPMLIVDDVTAAREECPLRAEHKEVAAQAGPAEATSLVHWIMVLQAEQAEQGPVEEDQQW